jgi:hypothetical protein
MVDDIRTVSAEDHWSPFATAWTALMTYRYLGKVSPDLDAGVERETMPLRRDMRNSTGGVLAAPLCIAAPEPYWLDSECVPAPVVMSYEVLDPARNVRQVVVEREVIHLGRTMGFSRSRILDADDLARVIAISSGMGVSLGDVPDGYEKVDNPPIAVEHSAALPPLHEVFGAERGDDGLWRLPPLKPELSAPHAALHLGPINIVLEVAAMEAAAEDAGTDALQVESWHVMMERPGVVGPFRAQAIVNGTGGDRVAVAATLHDEAKSDRAISTAMAMFRRV